MSSWHSYPSIYNLGHRAVADLLNHPHIVEEKVDGSQFSFGVFPEEADTDGYGPLRVRSKGAVMNPDAPEKMFTKAVETVKRLQDQLHPGWTYRAEYLAKPKHNALAYDRTPKDHIILFDVSTGEEEWLSYDQLVEEGQRLGLEVVPCLNRDAEGYHGMTLDTMRSILDNTQSVLGGQLIEGVVIKPYGDPLYGPDKKTLMGKFVSERFREVHKREWKAENPTKSDVVALLVHELSSPARFQKAVQHLREAGRIEDSPRDIGALIKEVQADILKEESDYIKEKLFKWGCDHILRGVTRGVPEWYKNELLRRQFEQEPDGRPTE